MRRKTASQVRSHSFATEDAFIISVTATDKDNMTGEAATTNIDIGDGEDGDCGVPGTAVLDANGNLVVTGTNANDQIWLQRQCNSSVIRVRLNHHSLGLFTPSPSNTIHVCGLDGNDHIRINQRVNNNTTVDGGNGNDRIWGGGGNDTLLGEAGNDRIWARWGNDLADGGEGCDQVRGGHGTDTLLGGAGNDLIDGGDGDDDLRAGEGNDILHGGSGCGGNVLDGGMGDDKLIAGGSGGTLIGGDGNDTLKGGDGRDYIVGGLGNDSINGGADADICIGGLGNDLILGGSGRDIMLGGDGADRIEGNADEDILITGTTSYDAKKPALLALLDEWTACGNNASRIANITAGTGLCQDYRLVGGDGATQPVFNDNYVDVLTGGAGIDWFFANRIADNGGVLDTITDLRANELWTDTDF